MNKKKTKKPKNTQTFVSLILALALVLSVTAQGIVFTAEKVLAAAPPVDGPGLLLAAGERTSVIAETTGNITTTHNGTEWYNRSSHSIGFAPEGAIVELNTADVNFADVPSNPFRLSWHLNSGFILGDGWRVGDESGVYSDGARYIYQSNSLPSYYPSGPQENIDPGTVTDGGWTLCYSGSYVDSGEDMTALFANTCTQDYLMLAGTLAPQNLLDVKKDGSSVLDEPDGSQEFDVYNEDVLTFDLLDNDGVTPVEWNDYIIYETVNCNPSECSPNDSPDDDLTGWDAGTLVTNGQYTIPASAENEWLHIYQADDDTGDLVPGTSDVRLRVTSQPEVITVSTCAELAAVDEESHNNTIILDQDIDCSGIANFEPLDWDNPFEGTFEGQGHTISNLTVDRTVADSSHAALVRYAEKATFRDITIKNSSFVTPYSYAGALLAEGEDIAIENVHAQNVNVETTGEGLSGGIAGFLEYTLQSRVYELIGLSSSGNVSGGSDIGGLFGELEIDGGLGVVLSRSFSSATVENTIDDQNYINFGGLIGDLEVLGDDDDQVSNLTIADTYASGNVSGTGSVGGLVGDVEIDDDDYDDNDLSIYITRSYTSGEVTATFNEAGGLIGNIEEVYNDDSVELEDNFTAGPVGAGAEEGGIVGRYELGDDAVVSSDNYFDASDISICSPLEDLDDCNGISEAANPNYFKNNTVSPPLNDWDFDTVWSTTTQYPVLRNGSQNFTNAELLFSPGNHPITVEWTGCYYIDDTATMFETTLNQQDVGFDYPRGLVGFTLSGCDVGRTAQITVTFFGDWSPEEVYARKYNPDTGAFTTIPDAVKNSVIANNTSAIELVYEVTDGGPLDQDGVANGEIVDPVGLALSDVGSPNTGLLPLYR